MAIEAPFSKYKKTNLKIYIGVCILLSFIFAYDGYLSKYEWSHRHSFYEKHVKDGKSSDTMLFNQIAPAFLVFAAFIIAIRLWILKDKKLIADETALIFPKQTINYDSIEKINKTYFDSKGYFTITYKNQLGKETDLKLSDKNYDNLSAVLEHLVEKIT